MYSDNPIRDYADYDYQQCKLIERLPRCSMCDEPILTDSAYYINNEWYCESCIDDCRKVVDIDDM